MRVIWLASRSPGTHIGLGSRSEDASGPSVSTLDVPACRTPPDPRQGQTATWGLEFVCLFASSSDVPSIRKLATQLSGSSGSLNFAPLPQDLPCATVHSVRRFSLCSKGSKPRATVLASDGHRDSGFPGLVNANHSRNRFVRRNRAALGRWPALKTARNVRWRTDGRSRP